MVMIKKDNYDSFSFQTHRQTASFVKHFSFSGGNAAFILEANCLSEVCIMRVLEEDLIQETLTSILSSFRWGAGKLCLCIFSFLPVGQPHFSTRDDLEYAVFLSPNNGVAANAWGF